jgi:2-polyprenyl-3-methyl-5-hydroxy-6-metoxy-1,4-benzoquinol methylase
MGTSTIDETRLESFMGRVVTDMAAAASAPLVLLGERLGLYEAMAGAGRVTPAEVAARAGVGERIVREWLNNQAASGYVEHFPGTDRYELPPEHALALADRDGPFYVLGGFEVLASLVADEPKVAERARAGEGFGWEEHDHRLFHGTERFFRPGYARHLLTEWIPALDGIEAKLRAGARVADVGCGHGASTVLMAQGFPASTFAGFDMHEPSIEAARAAAERSGVAGRTTFATATAATFPGEYDLVAIFDALHDMGDPVGAARHVREALAPGGTFMVVEPRAGDDLEDNLNPVGRLFYAASTLVCTPASLAQPVGLALGAQAGEERLRAVLEDAGFAHVRRAAETPFNMVLEARP